MKQLLVAAGLALLLASAGSAQDEPLPARVAQAYQDYEDALLAGDQAAAAAAAATAWRAARSARIDPELVGILAANYGELALARGAYDDAYEAWRSAAEISDRLRAPAEERALRWYRASLSGFARGELGDARQSSLRAARAGNSSAAPLDPALSGEIHYMIASTSAQLGQLRAMGQHARLALDGFQASGRRYDRVYGNAYYLSGVDHFFWGDHSDSVVAFQMSRGINAMLDGPTRDVDVQTAGYWIYLARLELGRDERAAVDARIASSEFPETHIQGVAEADNSAAYDVDAVPVQRSNPPYPHRALEAEIDGFVLVRFDVTESGRVEDVEIVAAAPGGVFDQAIERVMRSWTYEPAMIDGQAVRRERMLTQFHFSMCTLPTPAACRRLADEDED